MLRRTFLAIAAFLSAEGASRRELLGRGVLFVLVPWVIPIVLGLVNSGGALLFPDVPATTSGPASRTNNVVGDWMMIMYSGFGIACECVGLSFFGKLRKTFGLVTALALLVGLFSVLFIMMLFFIGVDGAVDLISPGARIWGD